jgi:hypothetical protein
MTSEERKAVAGGMVLEKKKRKQNEFQNTDLVRIPLLARNVAIHDSDCSDEDVFRSASYNFVSPMRSSRLPFSCATTAGG